MKIKILISILLCIGLMLCFIACSGEDTGESGNNPTESSASSQNGGGESKPSDNTDESKPSDNTDESVPSEDDKTEYHTVTFVTNNGTTIEPVQVEDGRKLAEPNEITRLGYTFDGWYLGEEKWSFISHVVLIDLTLEAKWIANDNTLVFDGNGATGGTMENMTIKSDEAVVLSKCAFAKVGYTFMGWSTTPDGEVEYADGAEYTIGTEASYTLYAVWEANIYTITYEKNGGTGELKETFTIEDLPLTLGYLDDKTNYVFNCWYKESDFSGEPVLKITEIGNVTLYAEYVECTDGLVLGENNGAYNVTGYEGTATEVVIPWSYKGKKITSIGNGAFYFCTSLTSITIPKGVTSIGNYAFDWCTSLTSVTIENGVKSIGNSAFNGCTRLTSITIPDSVTSIGERAFRDCTRLTSITIPKGVTSIGERAFYNCTSLTSITIPDSVISIGDNAFDGCKSLTSVTIENGVKSIGSYVFYNCTSLTSITIPNSVTSIGKSAFSGCTSLTSITIPDSVTSIGNYVFYYCKSLTSITIPDSVTSIGDSAFDGCTSLTSVTIGNSVTSIGDFAFSGCTSLTSITIPKGVTSIGASAFWGCTRLTIYCEVESKPDEWSIYWNDSDCPVVWGKAINQ